MSEEQAREIAELRIQLQEAKDTLNAITNGDVDALIVGSDIYSLDSASAAANKLRQDVLSQMDDPVMAFDNAEHLVFMNPAAERMYGKNASSALGRPKNEVFEELVSDGLGSAPGSDASTARNQFQAVSVHRTGDGESIDVETRISQLRDAKGQVSGQLYVIRNVSERVAAEHALTEANRQKDEFLATLAHELRNPLAPIRNALQIMRLSPDAEVNQKAQFIIERQLRQLVHLVDDLLDISRISQGKVELRIKLEDLNQIVQAAVETSRPLIEAGRHDLKVTLPLPQTLLVNADDTRLSQVISNLLNNAAKYTPSPGSIEISATQQEGHAVVKVRDTGVGIPVPFQSKVFDLFTQIDRTMERSQGGLGIGLALVKKLVDMHGGQVHVHSEGTGRGSEFKVLIPLAKAGSAPVHEQGDASSLPAFTSHEKRVLVVDDNVDAANTLAEVLGMLGYTTRTVHDGLEALRAAEEILPQVVILDIGLPLMNGHEVARRIRAQPWGREVRLIALSGWGNEEDRAKSTQAGFNRHFVKPVDLTELASEIDSGWPGA